MKNTENIISFSVNQNTDAKNLHNFIIAYLPFQEVLNLYKLLRNDLEQAKGVSKDE